MRVSQKGKYYGTQDIKVTFDEIVLSQYDYTVEKTPWHYHENPYFMFVLHGNMIDYNKKTKSLLPPGSLMFNNWQEGHYGVRHSKEASGFHLEFEKSWFAKNDIDLKIFEGSQRVEDPKVHVLFAQLYQEFLMADQYSQISSELLLTQICAVLGKEKVAPHQEVPQWVQDLKELVQYDVFRVSLQYLSEQLGVHPVHISRAVPKYLSSSLGEYIRLVKLKKAIPKLLDSDHSLTQIAYDCGFTDQSHFNRLFRHYFKISPGQYRKNLGKKYPC
ncbi:MAG: helix-turn-helix domain-containing protein [Bacteroidota bacterium]